jgi:hypothetical protein
MQQQVGLPCCCQTPRPQALLLLLLLLRRMMQRLQCQQLEALLACRLDCLSLPPLLLLLLLLLLLVTIGLGLLQVSLPAAAGRHQQQ